MASDDDCYIVRRFGKLNARVILRMQDQIVQLEQMLDEEDREAMDKRTDVSFSNNGSFRNDPREKRIWIMDQLAVQLERYSTFLSQVPRGHQLMSQQINLS